MPPSHGWSHQHACARSHLLVARSHFPEAARLLLVRLLVLHGLLLVRLLVGAQHLRVERRPREVGVLAAAVGQRRSNMGEGAESAHV